MAFGLILSQGSPTSVALGKTEARIAEDRTLGEISQTRKLLRSAGAKLKMPETRTEASDSVYVPFLVVPQSFLLLTANIVVCTLKRFPGVWKMVFPGKTAAPSGRPGKNMQEFSDSPPSARLPCPWLSDSASCSS